MLRRPFTFKRSDRDFDYPLPQPPPPARPPIGPFRRAGTGWTLGLVHEYPVRRVLTQSACAALVWQDVRMLATEETSTTRTVPRWLIRRETAAGIVEALCRRGQNTDHSGARPGRLPPLRLGRFYAAAPDCSDICQMDFFGPADKRFYNTGKSRGEQAPYGTHTPNSGEIDACRLPPPSPSGTARVWLIPAGSMSVSKECPGRGWGNSWLSCRRGLRGTTAYQGQTRVPCRT